MRGVFSFVWIVVLVGGGVFFILDAPESVKPLTVVFSSEPEGLMYSKYETMATHLVKKALFRGLVEQDDYLHAFGELVEYVPSFANKSVRITHDGRMIVKWQLKENLRWSDGVPLTTQDVLFTHRVLTHPDVPAYSLGRIDAKMIQELRIIDERRFVVIWKKPYARYLMFHQIYPKHILEEEVLSNPQRLGYTKWNRCPVGNGPYRVKEWRGGEYILLERNPFFHKPVRSEYIAFKFIRNAYSSIVQLLSGEADAALMISPEQRQLLMKEYGNRIQTYKVEGMGWIHIDMNLAHPILKNKKVRHALLHGIDRDAITKAVFLDDFTVSHSWLPHRHPGYVPLATRYPYNQEKALKILSKEGWVHNAQGFLEKDGRVFRLKLLADSKNKNRIRAAVIIKEYLRQIGIDLKLEFLPTTVFISQFLVPRRFDMALYGWYIAPEIDGKPYWASRSIPTKENGFFGLNFVGLSHAEIDRIHDRLPFVIGHKKRLQLFSRHQNVWMDELPALPLFITSSISAVNKGLLGWRPSGSSIPETWNCEEWSLDDF